MVDEFKGYAIVCLYVCEVRQLREEEEMWLGPKVKKKK